MSDPWPDVVAEFMASGPIGLLTVEAGGRIAHANEVACEILGQDLNGLDIFELMHPDDVERVAAASQAQASGSLARRGRGSIWRMVRPDGESVEILAHTSLVTVDGVMYGQIGFLPAPPRLAVLKSLEDVAAARPLTTTLATLIEGLASEENGVAINWVDPDGQVHVFGNLAPVLAGVDPSGNRNLDPRTPWAQAASIEKVARADSLDELPPDVVEAARAEGYEACCVSPVLDPATGKSLLYVNWVRHHTHLDYVQKTFADVLQDVVQVALDRAEDARQLHHAAHHDQLTGLANRRAFFEALTTAIAEGPLSVLYLDLDGFKPVNERFGHDAGDHVLVAVAERLRSLMPPGAVLARLGGDEFVIVVPDDDGSIAEALADRLVRRLPEPIQVECYGEISVGVSVGFSVTGESQPGEPKALMLAADQALRNAKGSGKGTWMRA